MIQRTRTAIGLAMCGILSWTLAGCEKQDTGREFDAHDDVENVDPAHAHEHGPHGGHIVELGDEEYHAEVSFDEATRTLAVYILGPDAATPAPVAADQISVRLQVGGETQEVKLAASPQAGEEGAASLFKMTEGQLPEAIHDAEDLQGQVVATIDGKQYRGAITHDHEHEEGHAHE